MNTAKALLMAQANHGRVGKVFDWIKAAELIAQRRPEVASAGLSGDWEYTGGLIFRDGAPVPEGDTYTYLASDWATPKLDMDGDIQPCFRMESEAPGWDEQYLLAT